MLRKQTYDDEKKEMEYEPDEEETVSFLKDDDDKPLILQPRTRSRIASRGGETTKAIFNNKKLTALLFLALCGIVFVVNGRSETAVFSDLASSSSSYSSSTTHTTTATHNIPIQKDKDGKIVFTCPSGWDADSLEANNIGGEDFEADYTSVSREITSNRTEFLASFRTTKFDAWGKSYNRIKRGTKPFKSKYFPKYLKTGSHLYESACGIGLNLFMTLEILQEEDTTTNTKGSGSSTGISGITVYGNEYVPESVEKARDVVLADGVIPSGNQQGTICAGDSTNLGHVPSGAFDLVYTGYITPNMDLLGFHMDEPEWDDWTEYEQICDSVWRSNKNDNKKNKKHDWMGNYLWDIMVQKQTDWYGKWVGEMARIAKPGVPVIIEQVSLPYCVYQDDWGGVVKEFWYKAARENTYGWDIDPESIEMMDDTIHNNRYNVFMLKNK